jgi:hypothetical protein
MDHADIRKVPRARHSSRLPLTFLVSLVFLSLPLLAEDDAGHQKDAFPDTAALLGVVMQREREADLELQSLVFKDDVTVSALDDRGQLRSTRTETRYLNASGYHAFALHITTNGKSLNIPFSKILGSSRLVPREWSEQEGTPVVVFSFEPQSPAARHGDLESRIARDLKGTVWVSPNDASIVRFEFRTVLPISLGRGYLGSIDSLEGSLEMQEAASNLWLPARQEYLTQGKNAVVVVAGLRFSKKFRTQQIDKLNHYAPTFDMVQAQPSPIRQGD